MLFFAVDFDDNVKTMTTRRLQSIAIFREDQGPTYTSCWSTAVHLDDLTPSVATINYHLKIRRFFDFYLPLFPFDDSVRRPQLQISCR
jgi:hypothetical protein